MVEQNEIQELIKQLAKYSEALLIQIKARIAKA
jgi:hypothetical protein